MREITLDENGMASGVVYHDPEGRLQRQRAELVVLACNGVGTPRLMLNSKSSRFPEGIANRSGRMTTPMTWALGGFGIDNPIPWGDDPERSVVNGWGRCHDVRNLFIVDGSIFVTAGAVNPTSTIQALALYIGDSILKNIGNLFD